jgi:hypothetical protein
MLYVLCMIYIYLYPNPDPKHQSSIIEPMGYGQPSCKASTVASRNRERGSSNRSRIRSLAISGFVSSSCL